MGWKNNLNTKLILSVLVIVAIFVSMFSYYSLLKSKDAMQQEISQYGKSLSTALSVLSIENLLAWDYTGMQNAVDNIGVNGSGICSIKVFHEEKVVAEYVSDCRRESIENNVKLVDDINFFSTPILTDAAGQDMVLGHVEVILSKETYEKFLSEKVKSLLVSSTFLFLGITLWTFILLNIIILQPIKKIEQGIEIIGKGDLGYRIKIASKDEIGNLAMEFNEMAKKLKVINDKNEDYEKNLKRKIKERTLELRELNENLETKISERTKDLEEEKDKTFSIIANFFDPIIVTDRNWRITLFNPAAARIFKLSTEDMGKKLNVKDGMFSFDNFKKIIKVPYENELIETDEKGRPTVEEVLIKPHCVKSEDPDNNAELCENPVIYKVLTAPVKNENGRKLGHMKMFYDLTREKAIDQMKNDFISISAHQLRTPLSGIRWSLKMILNGEMGTLKKEMRKYILKTYKSNNRLIKLVNDFLDVSRLEEGLFLDNLELVSIENVLEDSINTIRLSAKRKKIKIIFEKPKKALPKINVDVKKIKLSFDNLLSNAVKYSSSKSNVTVSMSKVRKDEKDFICILFKDHGIGINKEDHKRLFTKFFRAEKATSFQTEGSGLGLFIVKNIVMAHGGYIGCKSEEDKGSEFCLRLPINPKSELVKK